MAKSARVQRKWHARIVRCVLYFAGVLMAAASYAAESPYASGGDVAIFTSADGKYDVYIHTFTNASAVETFRNLGKRTLSLRYLVVGAGGAGAKGYGNAGGGGGGGGGGVYENDGYELAQGAALSVTVGQGAPAVKDETGSAAAGASILTDGGSFVVNVPGGGNGAYQRSDTVNIGATKGAAGGGGARYAVPEGGETSGKGAAGTYQSSQFGVAPAGSSPDADGGFSGGDYDSRRAGGGGGAGSAAKDKKDGGDGLASDITGELLVYGSGGGGGGNFLTDSAYISWLRTGGTGGSRAGAGGTYEVVEQDGHVLTNACCATAPAANSGCGGGGGLAYTTLTDGTGGADGIVVIRYQVPASPCVGGDIVIKRLVSGTRYSYVHIFTNTASAATFENQAGRSLSLRYLVVGGGGAGAKGYGNAGGGGGGGGGGVYENDGYELAQGAALSVTVGQGAPAVKDETGSAAAGASILTDGGSFVVNVPGGGNGAYQRSDTVNIGATKGAAGGGGARYAVPEGGETSGKGAAGTYQSSQFGVAPAGSSPDADGGFSGGDYDSRRAGGGGGAGSAAKNKKDGGDGLASDITGESLVYGSGGGGGGNYLTDNLNWLRMGGTGGSRAGAGGTYEVIEQDGQVLTNACCATAPLVNSGCGGGGGLGYGNLTTAVTDGTGGADGIVVIRYVCDSVRRGMVMSFR